MVAGRENSVFSSGTERGHESLSRSFQEGRDEGVSIREILETTDRRGKRRFPLLWSSPSLTIAATRQ